MKKMFFDAHMHAMNLSHPSLGAFIQRFIISKVKSVSFLKCILVILVYVVITNRLPWNRVLLLTSVLLILLVRWILKYIEKSKLRNFINILDTPLDQYFCAIEDDIVEVACQNKAEQGIKIGRVSYDKVAISPMMMEFTGNRSEDLTQHYKTAEKDIKNQTLDLINGIKNYHLKSEHNILQIYPFMGLTINEHTYNSDVEGEPVTKKLDTLFEKYFADWPLDNPIEALNNKHETFSGDINELDNHTFAGIKVYPPLGFDPWPDEKTNPEAFERVNFFYESCVAKKIPIVTHCGGKGFKTVSDEEYKIFTNPEKWRSVLERHPTLKICFGHFGLELSTPLKDSWTETIVELILHDKYDNVYADISNRGISKLAYKQLDRRIRKLAKSRRDEVYKRLLFGSDFPMNLIKNKSYGEYITAFSEVAIDQEIKSLMCEENPRRFIFGE